MKLALVGHNGHDYFAATKIVLGLLRLVTQEDMSPCDMATSHIRRHVFLRHIGGSYVVMLKACCEKVASCSLRGGAVVCHKKACLIVLEGDNLRLASQMRGDMFACVID